jgi:hypothetical protein
MPNNQPLERGQKAMVRFGMSGMVFTILGPGLFWLAYPLGPLFAIVLTELSVHSVRFFVFRTVVFPAQKGYRVSLNRYLISALPLTLTGLLSVALFKNVLNRTALTLASGLLSLAVGFLWSRFVYSQPAQRD